MRAPPLAPFAFDAELEMSLRHPGLICDALRPIAGAAAPALTAWLWSAVVGRPWPGVPSEGGEGGEET